MPTVAVIHAQARAQGAPRPGPVDALAQHWPGGPDAAPALATVDPDEALRRLAVPGAAPAWEACVVLLDGAQPAPGGSASPDGRTLRLLDTLQQALIPGLVLHAPGASPLGGMSLDGLIAAPLGTPIPTLAAMLFALCSRQATIRALEQTIRLNQAAQGEAVAEIDRLHDELLLAARVQREFLPKSMPRAGTFETAVIFRPASFVSGDIYDISRLDDDHLGFFLADAMGHGVPAALMTLFISANIPQRESLADGYRLVPPAEALARLNRDLCASRAGPTRFATAVCGIIDTRTGDVSFASAGHPPPLRIGPAGLRSTDVSGTLLGVVDNADYEGHTFRLDEGEVLLVHSDGVELALPSARPLKPGGPGPEYLRRLALLRDGGHAEPIASALGRLESDIESRSGSLHQHDDVTILAFERGARRAAA